MDYPDFEIIRILTSKYHLKVSNDRNDDLKCIICEKIMMNAYQSVCKCQYCFECIRVYIENGNQHCPGSKVECKEDKLVLNDNVTKNAYLNKEIFKANVSCPFDSCTFNSKWKDVYEHVNTCIRRPIECPYFHVGCSYNNAPSAIILTHLSDYVLPHAQLVSEVLKTHNNDCERSKLEIDKLKEDSLLKTEEIRALKDQINDIERELDNLSNGLRNNGTEVPHFTRSRSVHRFHNEQQVLASINIRNIDPASFIEKTFTIRNFTDLKTTRQSFYSPSFYSHTNGYKLRVHVYPGGRINTTHMSVYFIVCKGEYDDDLPWPFRCSFTISIMNCQTGLTHHSESYCYRVGMYNGTAFNRPQDTENVGYGFPRFISNKNLQSIVSSDDCMVMKCQISAPQ